MAASFLFFWNDKARIKAYKKICDELQHQKYQYHPDKWRYDAIKKKEIESDNFDKYWAKDHFLESDWYKFQKAVEAHRNYALDKFSALYEQARL
jgi:hypothetical protein